MDATSKDQIDLTIVYIVSLHIAVVSAFLAMGLLRAASLRGAAIPLPALQIGRVLVTCGDLMGDDLGRPRVSTNVPPQLLFNYELPNSRVQ